MEPVLAALKIVSVTSILDILIVAYVFYRLALLIRGTRATALIKGLVVLVVATTVSSWLHLNTVNWLLKEAMTALVVALPVVFQPELRRALEKLGQGGFFGGRVLYATPEQRVVDELVRACGRLSRQQWGALIVLERSTGLTEYLETGVRLDAQVSAELLVNLFYPGSPLHDGAVLISGGRVAAAACFLPLSGSLSLSAECGTRHRAALGISEQSDAVAVVVSEETGGISLALDGVLSRLTGPEELAVRLGEVTKPADLSAFLPRRRKGESKSR